MTTATVSDGTLYLSQEVYGKVCPFLRKPELRALGNASKGLNEVVNKHLTKQMKETDDIEDAFQNSYGAFAAHEKKNLHQIAARIDKTLTLSLDFKLSSKVLSFDKDGCPELVKPIKEDSSTDSLWEKFKKRYHFFRNGCSSETAQRVQQIFKSHQKTLQAFDKEHPTQSLRNLREFTIKMEQLQLGLVLGDTYRNFSLWEQIGFGIISYVHSFFQPSLDEIIRLSLNKK
jgi:hypothetical protein